MPVITRLGRQGNGRTANLKLGYICSRAFAQHIKVAIFYTENILLRINKDKHYDYTHGRTCLPCVTYSFRLKDFKFTKQMSL